MSLLSEEERQEALSKRYVDAARVVRLASGKFVVFSMTRGDIVGTAEEPEVNSQLGDAITEACQKSSQYWLESQARELLRKNGGEVAEPMAANAEDMGL